MGLRRAAASGVALRPSPPGGHIGDDGVNCSRVPQPMIVARVSNPLVRKALCFAAHVEEDVVLDARLSGEALQRGFPRLLVRDGATAQATRLPGIPVVDLTDLQLARWEIERRADELPLPRLDFLTRRLKGVIAASADGPSWVDKALGDLSRAAGARLPLPLRAFARRVLEFPIYYRTLHSVAKGCGLSRGALKARFRRRGLESPYTYLRWLRLIAVAQLLSDRTVTVAAAASRLGFTSDGNLCRMMASLTRLTPTEARSVHGWNTLLISFAWQHLSPEALDAWAGLGDMFVRRVA